MQNIWAVVPAAGHGSRMQTTLPKQYMVIGHKTMIEHTLDKLLSISGLRGVMVAISAEDDIFQTLDTAQYSNIYTIEGGAERADSVHAALRALYARGAEPTDWVLVHDAARPCVTQSAIVALLAAVKKLAIEPEKVELEKVELEKVSIEEVSIEEVGNEEVSNEEVERQSVALTIATGAILASPVADTLKKAIAGSNDYAGEAILMIDNTVSREQLWHAHTPQCFRIGDLINALEAAKKAQVAITDEAGAIEQVGGKVQLVADSRSNLKITHPEDLALAKIILMQQGVIEHVV